MTIVNPKQPVWQKRVNENESKLFRLCIAIAKASNISPVKLAQWVEDPRALGDYMKEFTEIINRVRDKTGGQEPPL